VSLPLEIWAASCHWESYPWKNELAEQLRRLERHFAEALDDEYDGEHSPPHMLERAVVLAAFAIRRMVEKRLLTDRLTAATVRIRCYPATDGLRRPFHGSSGGHIFESYDFEAPGGVGLQIVQIANEIIHSSQMLVLNGAGVLEDGLLIASDYGLKSRLLHITMKEFRDYAELVLNDHVRLSADGWDHETGKVSASRE